METDKVIEIRRRNPFLFFLICVTIAFGPWIVFLPVHEGWDRRSVLRKEEKAKEFVRRSLETFHEKNGRYPTAEEGLLVSILNDLNFKRFEYDTPSFIGIVCQDHLAYCDAGILDPWGVPYVYENGTALASQAFEDVTGHRDDQDVCVHSVGDNVSFSSVGAFTEGVLIGRTRIETLFNAVVLGSVLATIVLIFVKTGRIVKVEQKKRGRSDKARRTRTLLFLAFSGGIGWLGVPYHDLLPNKWEILHPEAVAKYKDLLQMQREEGVLSEEIFEKRSSAFDELQFMQSYDWPPGWE